MQFDFYDPRIAVTLRQFSRPFHYNDRQLRQQSIARGTAVTSFTYFILKFVTQLLLLNVCIHASQLLNLHPEAARDPHAQHRDRLGHS